MSLCSPFLLTQKIHGQSISIGRCCNRQKCSTSVARKTTSYHCFLTIYGQQFTSTIVWNKQQTMTAFADSNGLFVCVKVENELNKARHHHLHAFQTKRFADTDIVNGGCALLCLICSLGRWSHEPSLMGSIPAESIFGDFRSRSPANGVNPDISQNKNMDFQKHNDKSTTSICIFNFFLPP